MAARRAPSSRGLRAQRAPTTWSRTLSTDGAFVTLAASTSVIVTSLVLNNPGIGETVRRTRGWLQITSDQAAAQETQAGGFGALVVSDKALALGITAVPTPITEQDDDGWFMYLNFAQRNVDSALIQSVMYEFDSKAMRRVPEGFSVAFVLENANTGFGLDFAFGISALTSIS